MVGLSETEEGQLQDSVRAILDFDRVIHEKSRLAVLYVVYQLGSMVFLDLRRATGMSKGNLSNHLMKLKEEGMVVIEKFFEGKRPLTRVSLSERRRERFEAYLENLGQAMGGVH